jgi:hypothetical protein
MGHAQSRKNKRSRLPPDSRDRPEGAKRASPAILGSGDTRTRTPCDGRVMRCGGQPAWGGEPVVRCPPRSEAPMMVMPHRGNWDTRLNMALPYVNSRDQDRLAGWLAGICRGPDPWRNRFGGGVGRQPVTRVSGSRRATSRLGRVRIRRLRKNSQHVAEERGLEQEIHELAGRAARAVFVVRDMNHAAGHRCRNVARLSESFC